MLDFSLKYLSILKTKLAGLNLTNILDQDEFYQKQILDSILPYQESQFFQADVKKTMLVVDVGFGGGFPILPLAKLLPDVKFVGVESKRVQLGIIFQSFIINLSKKYSFIKVQVLLSSKVIK